MWSCLFFYFGVDVREDQLIRAFSFGKHLCWSLFSLVQTAVFIVWPIQSTSGLMARICMSNRSCVRSCCWGHLDMCWVRHGSKWLSLTCVECWETPAFLVLLSDAVWCVSLTGSGFLEEKDDMEQAVALEQHKGIVPGCKHMDTTAARLC